MKKNMTARKWIVVFVAAVVAVMTAFCGIVYIVDPFFQYRVKDNTYLLNGWYVGEGLIKNYDYDTLILGSSMTQNFDMDIFRQELNVNPLHIGLGGMNWRETMELMDLANQVGKAVDCYVCIDLSVFTNDDESSIPPYLISDSVLSKLRYSFSYETWFEYMPVDVGFSVLKALGIHFPAAFADNMSIDRLENWSSSFTFSEDVVLENYKANEYSVSSIDTNHLLQRMMTHIDCFTENLDTQHIAYHFFFPPYSALYWCDAQNQGYSEDFLDAKEYFIQKLLDLGCEVYDFQSDDLIMDLNHYKDTTHYAPDINDWMVRCFRSGEYLVTAENQKIYRDKLQGSIRHFREQHMSLF